MQQVTLRDHANQVSVVVDHRQSADAVLEHQACCLFYWGIWTNACRPERHDVSCLHSRLLKANRISICDPRKGSLDLPWQGTRATGKRASSPIAIGPAGSYCEA